MSKGKIMRKFLGQTSTAASEAETIEVNVGPSQLRPSASQNTVHSARAPITCFDRSPDGKRAVIAGSKIFKTLHIDGSTITEDIDLRSIITSHPSGKDISGTVADQLNIRSVKWLHGNLDSMIVTACGNGKIVLYDLNRAGEGLEVARIQGHARQVHELAINPFRCDWLLSASQDGTVKSFDLRRVPGANGSDVTFRVRHTFKCNADAVRDVKWSPTDGMEFACSTDAGVVLKWDIRKPSAPVLKITAHQSACFSIAWHPDGDHLVSGGIDQRCYVWDVSKKAERGQRARYSFSTPAPISSVSWRPAYWSATARGNRAAQITVSYDDSNVTRNPTASIHLWDLARPAMPFKEIEQWDCSPSGLLWNTRDLLWSVDRDGHFTQTDVAFVPQLIDGRSLSSFGFSPTGDVLMLLEPRQTPRRPRPSVSSEIYPAYQHSSPVPLFSVSQSDSEEDVVGSFLGPRQRKPKRHHNSRSPQPLSTTPPIVGGMADATVMGLDDAVKVTGAYKPQQVMAIGHAPSTAKLEVYKYFSSRYLERMTGEATNKSKPANLRIVSLTEYFFKIAEKAGHYRLAQTWRLLGYTMNLLLTRRAEHHRKHRLAIKRDAPVKELPREPESPKDRGGETPRKLTRANSPFESPRHPAPRSLVNEDIESTSNIATPLVRPVEHDIAQEAMEAMDTPLVEQDNFQLPDPAHTPDTAPSPSPAPVPIPGSSLSSDNTESSAEGYDFYGLESYTPAVNLVAPARKMPLRLDYLDRDQTAQRMQVQRHDSGESFEMFSTSGDSPIDKFGGSQGSAPDQGPSLRDRVSSWENKHNADNHRASVDSYVPGLSDTSEEQVISKTTEPPRNIPNGVSQNPAPPPVFRIQEASVPGESGKVSGGVSPKEVVPLENTRPPLVELPSDDPDIIESDFLPWPGDPEFIIPPIDPAVLVQRCIDFEAQTGTLFASVMVLLFRPFLPEDAVDEVQAAAILRQYQHRLTSMKLFIEAALLRNLCVPLYPSVFAMAQENITVGYFCTDCHKPLENDPLVPNSEWRCPRCTQVVDPCSVCRQREPDSDLGYDEEDTTDVGLWWYCPGCGHGGHTVCMAAWHSGPEFQEGTKYSGGCCPLEGCLHPCLPGTWREQRAEEKKIAKQKELDLLIRENSRQGAAKGRNVRRDTREVNQSKAVEGVRAALGVGGLDRKKSVKVVAPGEEG